MAVKPEECVQLAESEKAKLKELEAFIDTKLKKEYIKGNVVKITITKPSERVLNDLVLIYKNCGWSVVMGKPFAGGFNEPYCIPLEFNGH